MRRVRLVAAAGFLVGLAAACKSRSAGGGDDELAVRDSDVLVRVVAPGLGLPALELEVAIPIEQTLAGLDHVVAIDTRIEPGQVELELTVEPGADAGPVAGEVAQRLRASEAVRATAEATAVTLVPRSRSVLRFESTAEHPQPPVVPGALRISTCGPKPARVVRIDPARLGAAGLGVEDVLAALMPPPDDLATATLPGGGRLGDGAGLAVEDTSRCRVVTGAARHLASLHYSVWNPDVFDTLGRLGWSPLLLLGGQVELVIEADGRAPEQVAQVLSRITGVHGAVAMEELGPPRQARIIFSPRFDTRVHDVARDAVAAVPGVRMVDLIEGGAERAEAVVTGPDRLAAIARARAALDALAQVDPDGSTGCIGCDLRPWPQLRMAEASSPYAALLAALLDPDGLALPSAGGAPLHVVLDTGPEPTPQVLGQVPVRRVARRPIPLASIGEITISSQPNILLRHQGQPAVLVWKRPRRVVLADAKEALARAFPGAPIRTRVASLW